MSLYSFGIIFTPLKRNTFSHFDVYTYKISITKGVVMKEIEYDISMIDCLINALMQHYEEKPIPNYSNIRNELFDKQLKLLHLVYSFFTSGTLF